MNQKFTSTIAGASIFISIMAILSRSIGFLREMIFAGYFGTGKEFDLYLVGAVLPVTINNVIIYIGQNFFIPKFQGIDRLNKKELQKYYNQSFILFITAGVVTALVMFLLSDIIIDFYMRSAAPGSKLTAINVLRIFLITIPLSAGISMISALLQTVYEFTYPSISALFLNVSIIVLILLISNRIGVYIIPIGYSMGTLIQFCYLLIKSKKYFRVELASQKIEYDFIKSVFGPSLFMIVLIESLSQLYSIFDRYFYDKTEAGGIASLNYGMLLFSFPILVFSLSLSTVVFPKISSSISTNSKHDIERIFHDSTSINLLFFVPITFLFFYFGDAMIKFAFERGKFIEESTTMTFGVLKCYSIGLVFLSVYVVLNKIFYSLNLIKLLLVITVVGMLVKLMFNVLLVNSYQQYGMALSTSISYLFFFIVSYIILTIKLKIKNKLQFIRELVFYTANCIIIFLFTEIIIKLIPNTTYYTRLILLIANIIVYSINLLILRPNSLNILVQVFQRLNINSLSRVITK